VAGVLASLMPGSLTDPAERSVWRTSSAALLLAKGSPVNARASTSDSCST